MAAPCDSCKKNPARGGAHVAASQANYALRERLSEQAARWREQAKALPAGGRNER